MSKYDIEREHEQNSEMEWTIQYSFYVDEYSIPELILDILTNKDKLSERECGEDYKRAIPFDVEPIHDTYRLVEGRIRCFIYLEIWYKYAEEE